MDISSIKNTREFFWTNHSKYKLLQYGLSPTAVKSVIRRPDRTETGIAPKTTAVMKRKDTKKTKKEVWVMIQKQGTRNKEQETKEKNTSKTKIISAWIYPGVSPKGKDIYVPEDAWEALEI
ncbi:MAG: hypothetical protein Q7U36_00315 [bacterium]|nr:hypothetical protein [bacterium]